MGIERQIRLESDGEGQTIHIPSDLALPGKEAVISKLGDGVLIRPAEQKKMESLLEWLQRQEPIEDEFPDVDEGLLPPRDVNL